MNASQQIFRAYDIRGVYPDPLSPELMRQIGQALGTYVQSKGEKKIILARDGRLSGPVLSQAMRDGLLASGCDVCDVGMLPTPLLYFSTHITGVSSGVMITGSHNPSNYNGVKMVVGGTTLSGDAIQTLCQYITDKNFLTGQGELTQQDNVVDLYIKRICDDVVLKKPLKIAIDCGNGVAGCVAPQLFRQLGCEVIELFCEVDGAFPNHHPDPSQAKNLEDLQRAVKKYQADVGLAFDGDGDRLGVVTCEGEVIWPDRQLILLAQAILKAHPGEKIIFDVKCTKHLKNAIESAGGQAIMTRTGHSFVKAKLHETGAALAGEMSGHIFYKDRWYGFDDGLYTGARLLEILSDDVRSSAEVFEGIPDSINTPELQLPIDDDKKFLFMKNFSQQAYFDGGKICDIDGVRVDFADGWGLVRASNTTPCLVLRFEADTQAGLERIQSQFRQQLLSVDPALELPF